MRNLGWGLLIVVLAVAVASEVRRNQVEAQQPPQRFQHHELIALTSDAGDRQQVTVIDPRSRTMSVYHVAHTAGTISLKSVRSIQADLQMDEFNTESPLPRDIRAILEQK